MPGIRKKLIEVSIPLEAINAASAREKSIRHGHPSTLHLWWARRPLAACRAILFAQLVDDPSSWPGRFPTEEAQDAERKRLHKIIEKMVPWEASNDDRILNEARWEIARSVAWGLGEEPPAQDDGKAVLAYLQAKAPPVYDPFCGGGSIPLEAQRLGLRAYGSDLNPVAVLISKALVEIPPKFAGLPPVNPTAQGELRRGGNWNGSGAQGLAEDVRYYGQWMRDEAERRVGHLYPKAKLPDGTEATVIAWIWARTVRSPDPSAKGARVPLVSTYMLSTREGRKAWVELVLDASSTDGYRFVVRSGQLDASTELTLKKGTKSALGQAFICPITNTPIERSYIQTEGKAGRLGRRLLATVCEGARGRVYLSPTPEMEGTATVTCDVSHIKEARDTYLSGETPTRAMITGGVCSAYGLKTWGHLFTDRQIVALSTFADLVTGAREQARLDAIGAGLRDDGIGLEAGGFGATGVADAIAIYLGISVSRQANRTTSLNFWDSGAGNVQQVFGRQAFAMTWDFAESNPFSDSSGNFLGQVEYLVKVVAATPSDGAVGSITQIDATKNGYPIRPSCIATDPPYYDNIGYATLSDFFYVWLRQSLLPILPDLFRRLQTPKQEELVATPIRHGGKNEADAFFMKGMAAALGAMRTATADTPLTIFYAFKQSEAGEDGVSSAGWAAFLQAIVDAGLSVDGTWPVRTELVGNLKKKINALASSIVLVCRRRSADALVATRAEFVRALKRALPEAIKDIRKAGVGPVDMQQSVIGPGMGVFTRFTKVLEDDDSPMSVRTALALINRVWEELENELEANFDAETQVALAWFATYGFDAKPSGELITLANAKNVPLSALFESGVFKDMHGRTCLMPRGELPRSWSPVTDQTPTIWECVQHTVRVLAAEHGGGEAAAMLVAQMGAKAADARLLAERLYQIASQKGWQQEALVYNELAQEWTKLEDIATRIDAAGGLSEPAQAAFAFGGAEKP